MPVQYILMMAISIGVSFVLTWMFGYKDEEPQPRKETESEPEEAAETAKEEAAPAEKILYAPIKGNVIARDEIPDAVFASGALGEGVGIEPERGEVIAPCDGEVVTVTETKHAVGLMEIGWNGTSYPCGNRYCEDERRGL